MSKWQAQSLCRDVGGCREESQKDILEVTVSANTQFKGKKVLNRGHSRDSSRHIGERGWVV